MNNLFSDWTKQLKNKLAYSGTAVVLLTTSLGSGLPLLATQHASADVATPIACQGSVDPSNTDFPAAPTLKTPLNGGSYNEHAASFDFAWNAVTSPNGPVSYEWESSTSDQTDPATGNFLNRLGHQLITATSITDSNSPEGTYFWHVRAIDSSNLTGNWSDVWGVTINNSPAGPADTTAPAVTFTGPTTVSGPTVLTATVTDANPTACQFTVTDAAGNIVAGPTANNTAANSDPNTVSYNFGMDNNGNALPEGTYTVSLDASDVAGNHNSVSEVVTIDTTQPTVEVYNPTTGSKLHGSVAVTGTASDDHGLASYAVYVCNVAMTSCSVIADVSQPNNILHDTLATLDTTQFSDGVYRILLIVNDQAGNSNFDFNTVTIDNADATVKAPTLLFPVDQTTTTTSSFSYSWNKVVNAYKPIKYQWELSTSTATNQHGAFKTTVATSKGKQTSVPSPTNLADGTYYWHVRAINGDGIKSDWSEIRTITYDVTPANTGGSNSNGSGTSTVTAAAPQILTAASTSQAAVATTPANDDTTTDNAVLGTATQTASKAPAPSQKDTIKTASAKNVCSKWLGACWYWTVAAVLVLIGAIYTYLRVADRDSKTAAGK